MSTQDEKDFSERIKGIIEQNLNESPKETTTNRTSVGSNQPLPYSFSSFNQHNYRLYFSFFKGTFHPQGRSVGGRFMSPISKNYNSELQYEDSITHSKITVKKNTIEVRYKEEREWHHIDNSKPEQIEQLRKEKRAAATALLKEFISIYGGRTDYNPINEYCLDNAIRDNTLTEKQPLKVAFETQVVKKLYKERKLEYKSTQTAMNAAHNAGLYDFSPVIAQELDKINTFMQSIPSFSEQLQGYAEEIKNHREVQKMQISNQAIMNVMLNKLNNTLDTISKQPDYKTQILNSNNLKDGIRIINSIPTYKINEDEMNELWEILYTKYER